MFSKNCKFSDSCELQDRSGIKRLDQIGTYLIIVNRTLFDGGVSHRFTVVNEMEKWVDSVHGSYRAAQKHTRKLLKAQ